jgi:hypothetical protein
MASMHSGVEHVGVCIGMAAGNAEPLPHLDHEDH